jgi:hypothetical protein
MAPSCAKQFPNAYYMLATLFAKTNIDEALRCCVLAEKAENERLPFLQPVNKCYMIVCAINVLSFIPSYI